MDKYIKSHVLNRYQYSSNTNYSPLLIFLGGRGGALVTEGGGLEPSTVPYVSLFSMLAMNGRCLSFKAGSLVRTA